MVLWHWSSGWNLGSQAPPHQASEPKFRLGPQCLHSYLQCTVELGWEAGSQTWYRNVLCVQWGMPGSADDMSLLTAIVDQVYRCIQLDRDSLPLAFVLRAMCISFWFRWLPFWNRPVQAAKSDLSPTKCFRTLNSNLGPSLILRGMTWGRVF